MKIWSNTITIIGKNKLKIFPGVGTYDIDYKDPDTAQQLRVLRKHGQILFRELLDGDIERSTKYEAATTKTEQSDGDNLGDRQIQKQETDEGGESSEVAERRDGNDSTVQIRRTRRTKKRKVEETD